MMGLLLLLISVSQASWLVGNPPSFLPFLRGQAYPLYPTLSQIDVQFSTFRYGIEAGLINVPNPCEGPNPSLNYTGKVLVSFVIGEVNAACSLRQLQALYASQPPLAFLEANDLGDTMAWGGWSPYDPPNNDIPIFYTGFRNLGDPYGANYNPMESGTLVAFLASNPNTTIILESATQNPSMLSLLQVGPYQATIFLSIAWGLFCMLLAAWKFSQFTAVYNRIRFSVPILVILLMFAASFWVFLSFGILGGSSNLTALVPFDVNSFLITMPIGFLYSGIMILGFYFAEVATLTSAQSVPGLDKLLIPSIIWIALIWGIVFAVASTDAADSLEQSLDRRISLNIFFFSMLAVVLPVFATIPMIWGSLVLIRSLASSQSQRGVILRVAGLTLLLFLIIFSLIMMYYLFRFQPGAWVFSAGDWITAGNIFYIRDFFFITGFMTCVTIILLNFSVSVTKDIEISKSGTSSTSSSSGMSSSNSSGSSKSDPVIEL